MTARTRNRSPLARTLAAGLVLCAAGLEGCGLTSKHAARKIEQRGEFDLNQPRELQMVSLPPYVVEPPDEIEVIAKPASLDLPNTTAIVRQDGVIDLGFHGDVYVSGLTLRQVEEKIADLLRSEAAQLNIADPVEVSVRLVNGSQSKTYYVLGAVTSQGKFPITGSETVLDAILQAGLRTNSMPEKAYVTRPHPTGGKDLILKIDWEGIRERGDTTTNYQIFPGDRINVPGGKPPGLLSSLIGG
ncbi:polysaccharide biosynthesis/export family protein [Isosphaeraceae bacterium EP7]